MVVRMFLAFPLTFLIVNGVTIVAGFVLLIAQDWGLGLVLLAPALPLMVLCYRFESKYASAARRARTR